MGLRWLQPTFFLVMRDAWCQASWHITETSSGSHVGMLTGLCIAIAIIYYNFYYVFSMFCITPLNQKSHVTATIFKQVHLK